MRRLALIAVAITLTAALTACGGSDGGSGGTTRGSTTSTATSVASCAPSAFLPALRGALDTATPAVRIVRAEVEGCRNGYARVLAVPGGSQCERGGDTCGDLIRVLLRADDQEWRIIASGPTAACDPGAAPAIAGACDALGLAPRGTTRVLVYLVRGEKLGVASRRVPRTTAVAAAAMRELLAGPNVAERAVDLGTAIPTGTTLRRVTIADGVATVDLSSRFASGGGTLSMTVRLAQVVHTLTQFPSVERVRFAVDGVPVTTFSGEGIDLTEPSSRADFESVVPAILVEQPAIGDTALVPVRFAGTANVFEAVVSYEIRDRSGTVLARDVTMAACGSGCRGAFATTIPVDPSGVTGTLEAYEVSAKDGSRINVVRIPVRFPNR